MDLREVLAINLRKQRAEKAWSQEELAHRADINRTYISDIERCRYSATVDMIDRLARAFKVEPAELLRRPEAEAGRSELPGATGKSGS